MSSARAVQIPSGTHSGPAEAAARGQLRLERDRYVAFAFAAADLLIELDATGRILDVKGAVRSVCGRDAPALAGTDALDLLDEADRPLLRRMLAQLSVSGRLDPVAMRLRHASGRSSYSLFGGCALPTWQDRIFLTVTLLPAAAASSAAAQRDVETGLLRRETFLATAMVRAARWTATDGSEPPREAATGEPGPQADESCRMTLIRIDGLSAVLERLPHGEAKSLMSEIAASLRLHSVGADTAGRIGDDAFGLIAKSDGRTAQPVEIERRISDDIGLAARVAGVADGSLTAHAGSVALASGTLDERDAARALAYTVKTFSESRGEQFTLASLQDGFAAEVGLTFARYGDLQRLIEEGRFMLAFQPIVRIGDRTVHHYEALSRFADGRSPYEVVAFSEGTGLVEQLDLAVCRKALDAMSRQPGIKIAINISGRSIQSPAFRSSLEAMLSQAVALRPRLIFELTESSLVTEVADAAAFVAKLRANGHFVCLDDFGTGAAAYSYLRHFDVDFVKIDGPFLRAAMRSQRDATLVAAICRLCADLGCNVIGEMIETEEEARAAAAIGVSYGQGWLYGRPAPDLPSAAPPPAPLPAPASRRAIAQRRGVKDWS